MEQLAWMSWYLGWTPQTTPQHSYKSVSHVTIMNFNVWWISVSNAYFATSLGTEVNLVYCWYKHIICFIFIFENILYNRPGGGEVLPYLGMVGGSAVMTPVFGISNPIGSLFYTSPQSDWPPLSAEKNSLSLSHLAAEILGPKFGLIFHQNVLFNRF